MSQEGFDLLKGECVNSGLCVECGACSAVCPNAAIEMKMYSWGRNPELSGFCPDKECKLCRNVCPARDVPLSELERRFFGRTENDEEAKGRTGVVRRFMTGHTTDGGILDVAVSGGVMTSILIHALETGRIDGAVLASFDPERAWVGKAKVATTKEEILSCGGSCYQPHPQLLGLREAAKMGLRKIAVTATPCNAVAIRKMMMREEFADIGSRIKLVMSNFCAAHWSRFGTEWLIKEKMGLRLEDVARMRYRARPFPGMFKVWLKDGSVREEKFVYGFLNHMGRFTPEDCRVCLDKTAYAADIAVGDTWGHPTLNPSQLLFNTKDEDIKRNPMLGDARKGLSMILVRSENGDSFLNETVAAGRLKVYPEDAHMALNIIGDAQKDKSDTNSQAILARIRRGLPTRNYIRD